MSLFRNTGYQHLLAVEAITVQPDCSGARGNLEHDLQTGRLLGSPLYRVPRYSSPRLAGLYTPGLYPPLAPPFESCLPKSLNLPAFACALTGRIQESRPCLGVPGFDGLLGSLDPHTALLVHGDCRTGFEAGAFGHEHRREARIARLQSETKKGLAYSSVVDSKRG